MIILETNHGNIKINVNEQDTPKSAANFLKYVKDGFYDGTIFHRVIDGFMIQGGGFTPDMQQKEGFDPIENEAAAGFSNMRGSVAMARTNDPHSASSQFFINVKDNKFLDHQSPSGNGWGYCAFGSVIEGMDVVDKIKAVSTTSKNGHQDVPEDDVIILKAYVEEDNA